MIERIFCSLRGGSWVNNPDHLHAAFRLNCGPPTNRLCNIGFRLVVRIKDE